MNGIVYLLRSPSGKGYTGITNNFDRRMSEYASGGAKNQPLLHRAIQKYGFDSFEKFVVAGGIRTKDALVMAERFYIKKHKTLTPNGYNLMSGGGYGGSHSAETREKQRKAHAGVPKPWLAGVPKSEKLRKNMSKAHAGVPKPWLAGVPLSEKHKNAIREGLMNSPKFEDRNKKISKAHTGVPLSEKHKKAIGRGRKGITLSEEQKAKISFTQRFNAIKKKYAKCGWSGCSEDDYEWKRSTTVVAGQIVAMETCN